MKNTYEKIKDYVLSLVERNRDKEVTRKTNYQTGGVYMLYVDCFTDDRIIPFYIGQTDNFQTRHKKHLSDLLALNRLDQYCYEYALLKGLYNGRYRSCKIFSYMINHGCTLRDFHMVILEEIEDDALRKERETEYINTLCAPFFGFNQMNCVSKQMDLLFEKCDKAEYERIVATDYENLMDYWQFGYASFNWYLMHDVFDNDQINVFLSSVTDKIFSHMVQSKKRLGEIKHELRDIRNYNEFQVHEDVWKICQETIKEYFAQNGLRSTDKQRLIIKAYLFEIEDYLKELNAYFKRYKDRIHGNIFDLLGEKYGEILTPIKAKVFANQEKFRNLEKEENSLLEDMFFLLRPSIQYQSHPLKSLYDGFSFVRKKKEDNVCYLNIEYTCFRESFERDVFPMICKIDYLVVRNGEEHARSVFIKNSLTDFFDTDELYYCESGFYAGPFNPYLVGNTDTHFAVSMEYKNGINEHTLCGMNVEEDVKVLKEIDRLIDDSTKIIYSTSGYKSTIKRFAEIWRYQGIDVLQRVACQCR